MRPGEPDRDAATEGGALEAPPSQGHALEASLTAPPPAPQALAPLGLLLAIVLLIVTGTPPREFVLAAILLAAVLGLVLLRSSPVTAGVLAVTALVLVGLFLRVATRSGFSDVLPVTAAAIAEALAGGNPYGHGFEASTPPGAPFAYGPLALLWYAPALEAPGRIELLASFAILGVLALRGRILGLALYAAMPALVITPTDGSNDTSAGLILLVALLVAARAPLAGGLLLALATAFKPYALAWLPALVAYAGSVMPAMTFLAGSALAWLPALWLWGADAVLWSLRRANEIHGAPYYSLAYGSVGRVELAQPVWDAIRFGAGLALAVASLFLVRSARSFVICGSGVFLATLYLGWWSTFAYVAALAPVICWHLDDWLGLDGQRVRWPGDPVAALTTWVDARWPIRRDWRPGRVEAGIARAEAA
jgi:hypothetical protein